MLSNLTEFGSSNTGGDITVVATEQITISGKLGTNSSASSSRAGGDVSVTTPSLTLHNGGQIQANPYSGTQTPVGGDIYIDANEITIDGSDAGSSPPAITTASIDSAAGRAGSITIITDNLTVKNGGQIQSGVFGNERVGSPGDITITANNSVLVSGNNAVGEAAMITSAPEPKNRGAAEGNITINAPFLTVENGGQILASTYGTRTIIGAGNVEVNADKVVVSGQGANNPTLISSSTELDNENDIHIPFLQDGRGDHAGNVTINAQSLELLDGGQVLSATFNSGQGGTVTLNVDDILISATDSAPDREYATLVGTSVEPDSIGGTQAKQIIINANTLNVLDGGQVISSTFAQGDAGNITVNAGSILVSGSNAVDTALITSTAESGSTGDAGSVFITTDELTVQDGAEVLSATLSSGAGGMIDIAAQDIRLLNAGLISTQSTVSADAGDIDIVTQSLSLQSDSAISSAAKGSSGDAGNITITINDELQVLGGSKISTESSSVGGGALALHADLLHLRDSLVSTSVQDGSGGGGNIDINTFFTVLNNSGILAQAVAGDGGDITLTNDYLIQDTLSIIDASSQLAADGAIVSTSPNIEIASGTDNVNLDFLDSTNWLQQLCSVRAGDDVSSFVVGGHDAHTNGFDGWQDSPIAIATTTAKPTLAKITTIKEAYKCM